MKFNRRTIGPDAVFDSVWRFHLDSERLERYNAALDHLLHRCSRMSPAAERRLKSVEIRCPVKGCFLAAVVEIPAREGTWVLYFGKNRGGTETTDLLNFAPPAGKPLWWTTGCRHGTARLHWSPLMNLLPISEKVVPAGETEASILAWLEEEGMRQCWGKRVVHPGRSWRPTTERSATLADNSISHARAAQGE